MSSLAPKLAEINTSSSLIGIMPTTIEDCLKELAKLYFVSNTTVPRVKEGLTSA